MFNKIFYFIKRSSSKRKCTLKQEKGFSLVEVIVAIVIISIVTLVLVNGTIMAVNVSKMNRAKTLSSAVASEKLELVKCMDYEDIKITADNPAWALDPEYELTEVGYDINYVVTWVDGVDSYKQVKISVSKEPMGKSVSVITQIYPLEGSEGEIDEHPPPENLTIKDDSGSGFERRIELEWEAPVLGPDSEFEIDHYNIYRDDEVYPIASSTITSYTDSFVGDNEVHSYYVTAVYTDGVESYHSNKVTTGSYQPPQNLYIASYEGSGSECMVNLAWDAPDTQLVVIEYVVYREGLEVGTTTDTIYQNQIGEVNYTFYVTAVYEGGIESSPSNTVTTESGVEYPPPQNLYIASYEGSGSERVVNLAWDAPDTQLVVIEYVVYRDGLEIDRTTDTIYQDQIGKNSYTFYVTAVYEGEIESDPSNTVTTIGYPPPQNLYIASYQGGGNNRKVNLAWDAPDTQLVIIEYVVYRDGVEIGRTTNTSYQNEIGKVNYTFYVTAVYEGGIESESSNEVTTQ